MSRSTVFGGVWGLLFPFCSQIFRSAHELDSPEYDQIFAAAPQMSGTSFVRTLNGLKSTIPPNRPTEFGESVLSKEFHNQQRTPHTASNLRTEREDQNGL